MIGQNDKELKRNRINAVEYRLFEGRKEKYTGRGNTRNRMQLNTFIDKSFGTTILSFRTFIGKSV